MRGLALAIGILGKSGGRLETERDPVKGPLFATPHRTHALHLAEQRPPRESETAAVKMSNHRASPRIFSRSPAALCLC